MRSVAAQRRTRAPPSLSFSSAFSYRCPVRTRRSRYRTVLPGSAGWAWMNEVRLRRLRQNLGLFRSDPTNGRALTKGVLIPGAFPSPAQEPRIGVLFPARRRYPRYVSSPQHSAHWRLLGATPPPPRRHSDAASAVFKTRHALPVRMPIQITRALAAPEGRNELPDLLSCAAGRLKGSGFSSQASARPRSRSDVAQKGRILPESRRLTDSHGMTPAAAFPSSPRRTHPQSG